ALCSAVMSSSAMALSSVAYFSASERSLASWLALRPSRVSGIWNPMISLRGSRDVGVVDWAFWPDHHPTTSEVKVTAPGGEYARPQGQLSNGGLRGAGEVGAGDALDLRLS